MVSKMFIFFKSSKLKYNLIYLSIKCITTLSVGFIPHVRLGRLLQEFVLIWRNFVLRKNQGVKVALQFVKLPNQLNQSLQNWL